MSNKISIETILSSVCSVLEVRAEDLISTKKTRIITDARQMYFFLCRKHTKETLESIGVLISKGHATVIHGNRVINDRIKIYKSVMPRIMEIEQFINKNI